MNSLEQADNHPDAAQLSDFLNGNLPQQLQATLELHLESCTECLSKMETIGGDTLGDRLLGLDTFFDAEDSDGDVSEIPEALLNHERYELIERIGVGGMGDVFRARQRSMDRPVAVKVLRKSLFENDRAVARFHNEIKVAARLNHPNIVHSYDADVSSGLNILVMELVEGDKLSDVLAQNGPMDAEHVIEIAVQVVSGLEYAHGEGMIHRDVKPQNIMLLPDGKVKITDFGLAKFMVSKNGDPEGSLTLEGEVFGTPDYIAPEQIRDSASADFRSDIYGLGCTMYFMLTGRPPFNEGSVGEKLAGHLERQATPLSELAPSVDSSLVEAIETMMRKEPAERFQGYAQIANVLTGELDEGSDFETPRVLPSGKLESRVADGGAADVQTALDLGEAPESSIATVEGKVKEKKSRRGWLAVGGIALVAAGLVFSGGVPNPFSSQVVGSGRTGKLKFAIVVPAVHAYYPEIQELYNHMGRYDDVEFEFIADKTGRVRFNRRLPGLGPREIQVERTLSEVDPAEVDGVIFTGGWDGRSPESTRYAFSPKLNRVAKRFIESLQSQGKPVGSICGGTAVLANAGVLRGRKVANCRYIDDRIKVASGANWSPELAQDTDAITVRDGLLVTAGNSINGKEVVQLLRKLGHENREHR